MDSNEVRFESFVRKSATPSQTVVNNWLDLARDGRVDEHLTWFAFSSGQGIQVGIPKRAFASEEQMRSFREFVRSKMGERCRFNVPRSDVA